MQLNGASLRGTRYCIAPDGSEVLVGAEAATAEEDGGNSDSEEGVDCHFHAGVE